MKATLTGYGTAALTMLCMDAIWLTLTANVFYRPLLGDTILPGFRPAPAIAFYVLYVAGVVIFAIHPALATSRWTTALTNGALLGLFCYATYDLTNQATLKTWSTIVTVVDMIWGVVMTACVATAGYLGASSLARSL